MRARATALALAALVACKSEPARREPAPTMAPAAPAPTAAASEKGIMLEMAQAERAPVISIEDRAQCNAAINAVASSVRQMEVAMEGEVHRGKALDRWRAVPAGCRDGRWYLLAARLQRWSPAALAVDDIALPDATASLTHALDDDEREVLAFVAFVAGLGGTPALPADACARATAAPTTGHVLAGGELADALAYVCGHAALAAGDAPGATQRFESIRNRRRFPDLELRLAQAAAARGDTKAARELARQAETLDETRARSFGATDAERQAIIDAARKLLQ